MIIIIDNSNDDIDDDIVHSKFKFMSQYDNQTNIYLLYKIIMILFFLKNNNYISIEYE